MFTGLIEKVGWVKDVVRRDGGATLTIGHAPWDRKLVKGESVAVNGVCLTVTAVADEWFGCELLAQTLEATNLGVQRTGNKVNLERALKMGDRLGGHFVTGHVDGVGTLARIERIGADRRLRITCSCNLTAQMIKKGSVACDGVSLTIAELDAGWFEVHIAPFTWENTIFQFAKQGDIVNIEGDLIGKYVLKNLPEASKADQIQAQRDRRSRCDFF